MRKKRKILYLMNVSWFWIKQRPQFLAEGLSKINPVTVVCLDDHNESKKLKELNNKRLKLKSLSIIEGKSKFLPYINFNLRRLQLFFTSISHSVIWFTSPLQFSLFRKIINKRKIVIYDCMDNIPAFYEEGELRNSIVLMEAELCKRANLIIASSGNLKKHLEANYHPTTKVNIVNNGLKDDIFSSTELPEDIKKLFENRSTKKVVYIGTISNWFDFETVESALENLNVDLILFGPTDSHIPNHPKITYAGIINHSFVSGVMQMSDALIMPFEITELIQGVNPVKAYEYIASGKPVILSRYEEVEAFENYTYLYENKNELASLFIRLERGDLYAKKDKEACKQFAAENTWSKRVEQIESLLESL